MESHSSSDSGKPGPASQRLLARLLVKCFGSLRWTPPSWLASTASRVSASRAWLVRRRKLATGVAAALLVLALAGYAGWRWYENLPKPARVSVSGTPPALTTLAEKPKIFPLRIHFGGSVARLEQIGKPVARGIRLEPALDGVWRWLDDANLEFQPSVDWGVGQDYRVVLERGLFPDHVLLETDEYRFSSAPFTANLMAAQFYQDPTEPQNKTVEATVKFSHPVDSADLAKRIELTLEGPRQGLLAGRSERAPFTVTYDKLKGTAFIHSERIALPPDDAWMSVVVQPGVRSARGGPPTTGKLEQKVRVPGTYNFFHVGDVTVTLARNAKYEPEQVLIVSLSNGAREDEIRKNLEIFVLPKDKPALQGQKAIANYSWGNCSEIGPEVLAAAAPLALDPIPTQKEYDSLHSFRFKAEVGRSLYVRLRKGVRSWGGYLLGREFDTIRQVPPYPKEVAILQDGALLALGGDKKVSVLTRGVSTVRFQLGRVLPTQLNHLVALTNGRLSQPGFNGPYGIDTFVERFSEVRELGAEDPGKARYSGLDLAPYLGDRGSGRGLFFLRAESWDPIHKHVNGPGDSRFLLVTDLGLLVKDNADGSHEVFVQSLPTGEPVEGASVEVIGRNGLAVLEAKTGADGHASIPTLTGLRDEKYPIAWVARRGEDLSFLPLDRADRGLDFSRFDVGGLHAAASGRGLDAFVFSDRGLYRPGDSFHVGFVVRSNDWKQPIAGVPLEAVVSDPRGLEVHKQKLALPATGLAEIEYRTEESAPTGNYQVSLFVVKDRERAGLLGSTAVRVEEFLPDRMRISAKLSQERREGWVSPEGLEGVVELRNLFGTPAESRRVTARVSVSPAEPFFRSLKDYRFFDPRPAKQSFDEMLEETSSDADGRARFDLRLGRFERGTYRLTVFAQGFEAEGGRGVGAEASVLVSPLPYLVGVKADGELHYVHQGSERFVEFVAVKPDLSRAAVPKLEAQLLEQRYVSVLTQQPNGTYQYQSVLKEEPVERKPLTIPAEGLRHALPTSRPGDFVLSLRDGEGTEVAKLRFTVAGKANLSRSLERNAELQIALAKADAAPGEELELQIKAPYTGAGLITIERERVFAWKWFKTSTTSTVERIKVPPELEGSGYVNVSFLRGLDSPEIFMSPLSYAVLPFSVSRAGRTLTLEVTSADMARPGEPYRMRCTASKPAKALVFAVDEGILQVARHATPDPLGHFFRKRALQVSTAQILDLLLPEFSIAEKRAASGGAEDASNRLIGQNLNPFKRKTEPPVAWWSGLVDVGPEARELVFPVPDSFAGSLRVMAVAASPETVGVFSKTALVRGPFVLTPSAPTFVAPGDTFEVGVGVSNQIEGSGADATVELQLEAGEAFELLDGAKRTLRIGEGRETSASFKLKAREKLGNATLQFTAAVGKQTGRRSATLSVRPALPFRATVAGGYLATGEREVAVPRRLHPEYRTVEALVSPVPLGLARGLMRYLDTFPYGCTEQLVSKAFPALVLKDRAEFGLDRGAVQQTMDATLRVLQARQAADGAFGTWAANSHATSWNSLYALHFLTEAKERGEPIPAHTLDAAIRYAQSLAPRLPKSLPEARERAYGLYLLARNGVVVGEWIAALRDNLDRAFGKKWPDDLTAVYLAGAYKLSAQEKQADRLLGSIRIGTERPPDYAHLYDGLAHDAQALYVMARHFPRAVKSLPASSLQGMGERVNGGGFNTLSSAFSVLGLEAYASAVSEAPGLGWKFELAELEEKKPPRALAVPAGLFPQLALSEAASRVRLVNRGEVGVFYQVTQAGFDRGTADAEIKKRLEIQREYRHTGGEVAGAAKVGEELEVHLKVRSVGEWLPNVAVVDLLPGGFEVVLARPAAPGSGSEEGENPEASSGGEEEGSMDEGSEHVDEPSEGEEGGGYEGSGEGEGEGAQGEGDVSGEGGEGDWSSDEQASNGQRWLLPIGSEQSSWRPEYADVREDRVVLYGSVGPEVREFVYTIRATAAGTFLTPPPFGESMYDRSVQARGLTGRIQVDAAR